MSEAIGPDSIYNMCQLAEWHMLHSNISFSQETVPTSFMTATIVPVPKKSSVSGVLAHQTNIQASPDPHQFAFGANRSTDDAK